MAKLICYLFSFWYFNLESHAYLLVICYFERSQCLFCSFGHNKRFAQTNDQKIGMRYELRVGIIICLRLGNLFWIQKKIAGVNRLLFPEAHVWLREKKAKHTLPFIFLSLTTKQCFAEIKAQRIINVLRLVFYRLIALAILSDKDKAPAIRTLR